MADGLATLVGELAGGSHSAGATDIAVLEHTGSTVEDRGDHLVVRTPQNRDSHWGHCVFVTDPDAVGDVTPVGRGVSHGCAGGRLGCRDRQRRQSQAV